MQCKYAQFETKRSRAFTLIINLHVCSSFENVSSNTEIFFYYSYDSTFRKCCLSYIYERTRHMLNPITAPFLPTMTKSLRGSECFPKNTVTLLKTMADFALVNKIFYHATCNIWEDKYNKICPAELIFSLVELE